jgi:prepilin-type N-terminal cleavage/methylation domain-containing protein
MRARRQLRSLTLPARHGFTLVELLVAVAIMLVLIGLALLVANSGIIGNARTSSGSDRISGWLMQAREKAKRDDAPRGIRFIVGPDNFIREAQLIEVPEPYTMPAGNFAMVEHVRPAMGAQTKRVFVVGPNAAEVAVNVSAGDTLSLPSVGTIHRVTAIGSVFNLTLGALPPQTAVEITFAQPLLLPDLGAAALTATPAAPTPTYSTTTFGFLRQARPTFGEPPYQLPESVAIDTVNCQIQPVNGNYDIVFSPTGEVQNTGGLGRIILWTRNPEAFAGNPTAANGGGDRPSYEAAGEMRLIVVYTKTGAVAVQPVALPAGPGPAAHDPYSTTRDGIASGL